MMMMMIDDDNRYSHDDNNDDDDKNIYHAQVITKFNKIVFSFASRTCKSKSDE